ncbi:MAG: cache domain-containing protein [Gammaproteobacteria bacterium]
MPAWIKRITGPFRRSLRYKVLALALFPILVIAPITIGVAAYWINQFVYRQLYYKVNTDLAVAHDVFRRTGRDYLDKLGTLAESYPFRTSLTNGDKESIRRQLLALKIKAGLAFLHLVGPDGRWLYDPQGRSGPTSPLLDRAFRGHAADGVELFSPHDLGLESPELAKAVRLPLLPTPRAAPTDRKVEDRGMVVRLMYPVKDRNGRVIAALDGGLLLNNDFRFVDAIRNLVYGPGSLLKGSIGTVTLFLDDVRVSTNVPLRPGERALGTRVSQVVRDQVLGKGDRWIDRAFVVNDWYISAYEPIYSDAGQRIGMLYAGFLEAPYRAAMRHALLAFLGLFFLLILPAIWLAVRGARSVFKPIEKITGVVHATRGGIQQRIGQLPSEDEIGLLAREFDSMLDRLQDHAHQIEEANDQLELKVQQRTAELQAKNDDLVQTIELLRQTRLQLVEAEKLAALGKLTAGVAHEVNNPVAVILGNIEVIKDELGAHAEPVKEEIALIIQQVYRIRAIIDNLLHYAKPAEYIGGVQTEKLDVNHAIEDTLTLLRFPIKRANAAVQTELGEINPVGIQHQALQQVLINLITNALRVLPHEGGRLDIVTKPWGDRGVVIIVRDNGAGMSPEVQARLFEPFFTTHAEGTGLGLSISYGLIRRYGGRITVRSQVGQGTEFRVWLLHEPEYIDDEEARLLQLQAYEANG